MGGNLERGTVENVQRDAGFGFIVPDDGSADIFVHVNTLRMSKNPAVSAGDRVEFERVADNKGLQAYRLVLV
jgi:CspA family cold shock protein